MAEDTQETGKETPDESLMSASDMIAQEIEKTSDAVQAEEDGDEGKESQETKEGKEAEGTGKDPKGDGEKPEGKEQAPARIWSAYTGDEESKDYKALDGLTVKFRANQEDHNLTLEELVREVQKKEGLAKTLGTRTKQRDDTHQLLKDAQEEITKLGGNEDLLLKILNSEDAYKDLRTKYLEAGGSTSTVPVEEKVDIGGEREEGLDPVSDPLMEAGRGAVEDYILPFSKELGELYGADPQEIAQEIIGLAGETPRDFFTEEVLAEIINTQIPALLVKAGFTLAEGKTIPVFDASILGGNGSRGYGIQKKGASPRGQTEQETKLEARIKELEAKIGGKGQSTDSTDQEKALASVSGGPSESGSAQLESSDGEINLDGAESASAIMKRLTEFEG